MPSVLIMLSTPVEQLTDRELLQTYINAYDLHDHLAGEHVPLPDCVTVMGDELARRGYQPDVTDVRQRLR